MLLISVDMGLVDSDMADLSVLARRPAPNKPFSSPLKDGILGRSLDCESVTENIESRYYIGIHCTKQ